MKVLEDNAPLQDWFVLTAYGTYYKVQDQDAPSAERQVVNQHGLHPDDILGVTDQNPQYAVNALLGE